MLIQLKNYFTVDKVDALISSKVLFNGIAVSNETDKYLTKTGVEASEYPDAWRNPLGHLGIFSHNWTEKEKALLIPSQPFVRRQDFPSAFEKNIYRSSNALKGLKNIGYNVLAVTSPYQPENGEAYQRKFNAASNAFKNWFSINVGPRYEITNDETFVDMLDDIEAKITTIEAKGEIVDAVNSKFKVVPGHEVVLLNGISLQKEVLPSAAIGFGLPEDGVYPYVYVYDLIDEKEVITWQINKAAKKDEMLQLKFSIELKSLASTEVKHILSTNDKALINYMSSEDMDKRLIDFTKTKSMPSPSIEIEMGRLVVNYVDINGVEEIVDDSVDKPDDSKTDQPSPELPNTGFSNTLLYSAALFIGEGLILILVNRTREE